ncbi:MAG TPA: FG-GAP-like repeat-containing protein [Chlorobiota bacterium]|nr:FG-GAP-like repeat-containing protein [Chlorobiota bacterium]
MRNSVIAALAIMIFACPAQALIDTIYRDNGVYSSSNLTRRGWDESVILSPGAPCRIIKVRVYYAGTGTDTLRIVGDASEGTLPPTQYVHSYNTLGSAVVNVTAPGWYDVDVTSANIRIGGYDRIVVQHIISANGPAFGMDSDGMGAVTSYIYDPITPNANFFNIPGIYYRAAADFMVRLVVDYTSQLDYPQLPVPAKFVDVTRQSGLLDASGQFLRADMASIVDWNSDGFEDVAVGGRFFQNQGDGTFRSVEIGITGSVTSWADIDGDGDMDCMAVNGFRNDRFYRNDGGTFFDVTDETDFSNDAPAVTPLWFDYDGDGDIDIFIANGRREQNGTETYYRDELYTNNGDWTFTQSTLSSRIAAAEPPPFFDTWGASLCDFNDDGRTDIFVATYRLAPDRLYRNNGDGTFTDVSTSSGIRGMATSVPDYFGHGMGSDWADIDNDGDADCAVGNLGHPEYRGQFSNPSLLWMNNGGTDPSFTPRRAHEGGVTFREMNAGMCFVDFDHDGLTDLWHGQISYSPRNQDSVRYARLFRNMGTSFADVTWQAGLDIHGAWTAVRFDYDGDGDLDLLCASGTDNVKLFRNDMSTHGSSLTLELAPTLTEYGTRRGYGSKVTVITDGRRQTAWLPGTVSGGRASAMSERIHFGLGDATTIDTILIRWTNGQTTTMTNVLADVRLTVDERGRSTVLGRPTPRQRAPEHGSERLTTMVEFYWSLTNSSAVTTQRLEISRDSSFVSPMTVRTYDSQRRRDTVRLDNGTWYWRLVATTSGDSTRSPVWMCSVGAPLPLSPLLQRPSKDSQNVGTRQQNFTFRPRGYGSQRPYPTTYSLRIARDSSLADIVADTVIGSDSSLAGLPLEPTTTYYWDVRAVSPFSTVVHSDVWSFTTYGIPGAPLLLRPDDGAINIVPRPRLGWEPVSSADKGYDIEYDTLADFSTSTVRERADTALQVTAPLKVGRRYYWRVRAKNDAGTGPWSMTRSFTVTSTTAVDDSYPTEEHVSIRVFTLLGVEVCRRDNVILRHGSELVSVDTILPTSGYYLVEVEGRKGRHFLPIVVTK